MLTQFPGEMLGINTWNLLPVCIWETGNSQDVKTRRLRVTSRRSRFTLLHYFLLDIVSRARIRQAPRHPESHYGISAIYYEVIMTLLGVGGEGGAA